MAIGYTCIGVQRATLDPLSAKALVEAAAGRPLDGGGGLVVRLGVADDGTKLEHRCAHARRPRAYHRGALRLDSPSDLHRHVSHDDPMAIGLWHVARLLIAVPLFALGIAIRVQIEERLLRTAFSSAYEEYASRVKRFIPGVL